MYKCKTCDKEFKSVYGLSAHNKVHKSGYHQHKINNAKSTLSAIRKNHKIVLFKYSENPNACRHCEIALPYIQRHNKFCSRSCSATCNNLARDTEHYKKLSKTLKEKYPAKPKVKKPKVKKPKVTSPYSKIWLTKCAHCNEKFISRIKQKYCNDHAYLYKRNNRNRYAFTFSLSNYPELFEQYNSILKEHGMWSYSNTSGITRDHKVSVNTAIRNGYDPYYIKHPLNCELMSWTKNNQKKTNCSISYETLKNSVDEYNNKQSSRY